MYFYPVKVATDDTGRIYVVARNLNMGIVTMTAEGKFMGYIGAPEGAIQPDGNALETDIHAGTKR